MMGWKVIKIVSVGVLAVSSALLIEIIVNPSIATPAIGFGVIMAVTGSAFLYGVARAEVRDRGDDA